MQAPPDPTTDSLKRRRGRGGRPPAGQAGDVDRRILDAATALFLRLGFDATSCDQVVLQAGAGKASLYARYANKEELFAAVVRRMADRMLVPSGDVVAWDLPVHARLRAVGRMLLSQALTPDAVALMRVVVTTVHRMPELARLTDQIGREGGVRCVASAIAGKDAAPEALARAGAAAGLFLDLVFVPHQMRALIGDDPKVLEAEAARRIDEAIELLSKAGLL